MCGGWRKTQTEEDTYTPALVNCFWITTSLILFDYGVDTATLLITSLKKKKQWIKMDLIWIFQSHFIAYGPHQSRKLV